MVRLGSERAAELAYKGMKHHQYIIFRSNLNTTLYTHVHNSHP
jgi:hypothetical protein